MFRELEEQRNMLAARCVQYARQIAALGNAIVAKDKQIGELQSQAAKPEAVPSVI